MLLISWVSPRDILCIRKQMHVGIVHMLVNGYTCTYTPFFPPVLFSLTLLFSLNTLATGLY